MSVVFTESLRYYSLDRVMRQLNLLENILSSRLVDIKCLNTFWKTLVTPSYITVQRLVLYDNKTEYHSVDQKDKRS